jgi:ElaB/YqjD/DUF883 family membrane-anchored ribosome-binding protein
MAEVWRRDADSPEARNAINTTQNNHEGACGRLTDETPAPPVVAAPANDPSLNRAAEALGRGVGTAVAEIRRLPRRLDDLKTRIHLVTQDAGGSGHHAGNSVEARVAERFDEVEIGLLELADKAAIYTSEIGSRANTRIAQLRREAQWKLYAVRTIARHKLEDLRRWRPERPLQVVMVTASAAFALGVMLRIWRSSGD